MTAETVTNAVANNLTATSTAALENKVVEMLDALQNGAVEIGHQVVKYTPDMIQAVYGVTMINGIQNIVYGILWLGVTIFLYRKAKSYKWSGGNYGPEGVDVLKFVTGAAAIVTFIISTTQLLDVWNYTAIVEPKLYIAHQIIDKALETTHQVQQH